MTTTTIQQRPTTPAERQYRHVADWTQPHTIDWDEEWDDYETIGRERYEELTSGSLLAEDERREVMSLVMVFRLPCPTFVPSWPPAAWGPQMGSGETWWTIAAIDY